MKPINYDEIFEKAEARRAALEAITPKLQAIYDLWDTLYAAARPINSVNADFEQLDSEAAALLAQSVGVSVSTLGCGLHYLANVMQMLDRPSKDLLEALKPNEEAQLEAIGAGGVSGPLSDDIVKDAARYRLLRRGRHWSVIDGIGNDLLRAEALDAAVDAARKRGGL